MTIVSSLCIQMLDARYARNRGDLLVLALVGDNLVGMAKQKNKMYLYRALRKSIELWPTLYTRYCG